ncbi:D-alanyl-D-alanine carboxypeptidase [Roseibium aquae]|uniref:D-alanyl-D-alanine carboxypeptidase n=1 Tax=Roseibium aquae TaxID=1323746 RepID=UPI001FCC32F6|nr:D-alanyl-D-alanine carboxypeptidase [Roseibium aquae]
MVAGAIVFQASPAAANPKYAGIVVDAKTGKTLYADNADTYRFPASLTKVMTLYIVFEELEAGRITLDSKFTVSKKAAAEPPSKIGLRPGQTIKVKDAILALVTKSANDVATAVAENIEGSEAAFARRMTQTARQLGMNKTTFQNAHGLPNSRQRTTARDMSHLGRAIQERFPTYFDYFNTRSFSYKGRRYGNHNKLLGRVRGVDGIKTGFIRASGFNLLTSVNHGGRSVVAVVMGGRTGASRNAHMTDLIGRYFHKASKGPRTAPLIASASTPKRFDAAQLAAVPKPVVKPAGEAPIALAAAAIPPVPPAESEIASTGSIPVPPKNMGSRMEMAFAAVSTLPAPQISPHRAPDRPQPVGSAVTVDDRDADNVVTVATSDTREHEPTWQIQIAATETESGAISMLKRAAEATGSKLRRRVPYTEPVDTDGQTLYRARFVGFETKTAAWDACRTLKRKNFACFAVYQ